MVGHQLHFHPAVKKMKTLIENNSIGELKYVYSNRLNLGKIRPNENVPIIVSLVGSVEEDFEYMIKISHVWEQYWEFLIDCLDSSLDLFTWCI